MAGQRRLTVAGYAGLASGLLFLKSVAPNNCRQKECILAIDDDEVCLGFLTTVLEDQGYRVLTAATPQQAIWIYEDRWREIDMVLLDFLLPPLTGDFVLDELQRLNPDVRVVLLTGCDEAVAAKMFQRGLRGYLQKPFKLADLARTMQDARLSMRQRGGTQIGRSDGVVLTTGGSSSRDGDRQTGLLPFTEQDESW
jgi:DNA-binding NtrC family response regulator